MAGAPRGQGEVPVEGKARLTTRCCVGNQRIFCIYSSAAAARHKILARLEVAQITWKVTLPRYLTLPYLTYLTLTSIRAYYQAYCNLLPMT